MGIARSLILLTVLMPTLAGAKINPTVAARECLLSALRADTSPRACFTGAGWKQGEGFVAQHERKGWTVHAGEASACCTLPVHWAEVVLKQGEREVARVFLILDKKPNGKFLIDEMTEKDPREP